MASADLSVIMFAPSSSSVLRMARKVPLIHQVSYFSIAGFYHFETVCSRAICLDYFIQSALRWSSELYEVASGIIEISKGNHTSLRFTNSFVVIPQALYA